MGNIVEPKTLKGFMELIPKDQILFNRIKDIIRKNYEKFGFLPIDTPLLEYKEVLLSKAGGETEKQIYEFTKGSTDIAMRFDLTVPLAKYVSKNYNDLAFPFRRYQIDKVYRGERPQKGRFRELYQADIDIIGDGELSIINDAEIPSIIYNIFREINIGKFTIRINNRKILNGLYEELKLQDKSVEILRVVDKIEKIGEENVRKELEELEISTNNINKVLEFINIKGNNDEILEKLSKFQIENEIFKLGLKELKEVVKYIRIFGVDEDYFNIDLSIARGLDYYTGTVYETMIDGKREIGSICSGGRYENLAKNFTNKSLPGVGISIGLTRLFDQLTNLGIITSDKKAISEVLVLSMTEDISKSLELVKEIRDNDIAAELYTENKKIKQKMKYADKQEIPYVVIIGEKEIEENMYTLKDMKKGTQEYLSKEDLLNAIR